MIAFQDRCGARHNRKCVPLLNLAVYAETFSALRPAFRKARDHGVLGQQSLGFLLPLKPCPELRQTLQGPFEAG